MPHLLAPTFALLVLFGVAGCGSVPHAAGSVQSVPRPAGERNRHYPGNRPPLQPSPLVKLPVTAVRPEGWLRKQLELQNDGFHGHLTEISRFLEKVDNAWLSATGRGDHGWEEVPYWLKGFADCAFLLDDEAHVAEAMLWLEGALGSQRADGFFGPQSAKSTVASTAGSIDLWPNMVMLACLQSYHEYRGDPRVLDLMRRYFQWEMTVPEAQFLPPYWQQQRGGDNLWSVYWLYNRTGEAWLLDLAGKIHRNTADWTSGIPDWHNVNMAQAFGGPTFYWMQSGEERHRAAAERNWRTFRERYGQVPGGMFGGDENCRLGFTDPRQAIETCGMVEMMYSCERLLQVTGDAAWGDRCEDVAFNSLPAALTADLRALRYLTAPNQPLSDSESKAPGVENGGPMFQMNPHEHRCCQHNFGHGWPYFVEHLWMATPGNGVAAPLYGPCRARVRVGEGDGVEIEIVETTGYPFRERIDLELGVPSAVHFPLFLRVPAWCERPSLEVDGRRLAAALGDGPWLRLDRHWDPGVHRVSLTLPMRVSLRVWPENQGSVSVDRGPLTYSLAIGERYRRDGGTDAWPAWSIEPTTGWNYGLWQPDPATIEVVERSWPDDDVPFRQAGCPLELRTRGKRIANWQLDPTGLVGKLAPSPVASDADVETITLVPMGAARLRISSFPVVDASPRAQPWPAPPAAWSWQVAASHCFRYDTLQALRDGEVPGSTLEPRFPRFTWWDHRGTAETVEYVFEAPRQVSSLQVWWFDDQPKGGCALPAAWRIVYRDGEGWRPVVAATPYGAEPRPVQEVRFTPVTTTAVRLEVQLQEGKSGGLWEWRVQ